MPNPTTETSTKLRTKTPRVKKLKAPQLVISVEQAAIDESVEKHSGHCMIAEAIRGILPEAGAISVDLATIRWTDKKLGLRRLSDASGSPAGPDQLRSRNQAGAIFVRS